MSGSQSTAAYRTPSPDSVRTQLTAGIPAAVIANGQAYVLICDPRQLSAYAGQNARITGTLAGNNFIVPDRIEVQQTAGNFQAINLNKPSGTANER